MPKIASKIMKSKVNTTEIKTNTVAANKASPNDGDKDNTSLLIKTKGRNKTSKTSEKSGLPESNDNPTEDNFQKPNDSSETLKEGVKVDDDEKGESQEDKNKSFHDDKVNIGHETSEDDSDSEDDESSDDEKSAGNTETYVYPMKSRMKIYGEWFPVENFPNPNPDDFKLIPMVDQTYGKKVPPFTHRFDVNWHKIREMPALFFGERFFPIFEWLRLELDEIVPLTTRERDVPSADDWGNHPGSLDGSLIYIPPHENNPQETEKREKEAVEIIESHLSHIRPISLTLPHVGEIWPKFRDRVYAYSLLLEAGPMEYRDDNTTSVLKAKHERMPRYDEWRWQNPTIWLPSLLGELYCMEGYESDSLSRAVHQPTWAAYKHSEHLSGAIIFIFGWRTETEFMSRTYEQQLERYVTRAHWVSCTDGFLFRNGWVKEFKTEMHEISRKLMNSAFEEDRWTNAFGKWFLYTVASRVEQDPVHPVYPVFTNDWELLLKGFPITEWDQEREDMEWVDHHLTSQNAVHEQLRVNRDMAQREQDERRMQAVWSRRMAYDDYDIQSPGPPPTLEPHGNAQFVPGFFPPRKPQYEGNKAIAPPAPPAPPIFPKPYSFAITYRREGVLINTSQHPRDRHHHEHKS